MKIQVCYFGILVVTFNEFGLNLQHGTQKGASARVISEKVTSLNKSCAICLKQWLKIRQSP